jgi:hypothetical protein
MNGRRASRREESLGLIPKIDLVGGDRTAARHDDRREARSRELVRRRVEVRATGDAVVLDRAAVIRVREEIAEAQETDERHRRARDEPPSEILRAEHRILVRHRP